MRAHCRRHAYNGGIFLEFRIHPVDSNGGIGKTSHLDPHSQGFISNIPNAGFSDKNTMWQQLKELRLIALIC